MAEGDGTVARIQAQMEAGELRVITNEHACGGGIHPSFEGFDAAKCAAFEHPVECPLHFVQHVPTRLEGPFPNGSYRAFTEEGDYCAGLPEPLLARLQAWKWMREVRALRGTCSACQKELAEAGA